jgi:ABC-2 type transport system ATP-binding protein
MEEVCFIADVAVLPRWIRVHQLIEVTEKLHPGFSRERCMKYLGKTKVRLDHKVKQLSKGMVTLLHLAIVSAIDAKLLVLDEPTLGLDIIHRKDFHTRLLDDYLDEDRTILITTHQVEEVEHILTDLIFIKDGRIALESTMEDVQERFFSVEVEPDKISEARRLAPIYETRVRGGQHQFMYDGVDRDTLRNLGDTHIPRVADLFVAIMNGGES